MKVLVKLDLPVLIARGGYKLKNIQAKLKINTPVLKVVSSQI